jgi:hypothetical protein
MTEALLLKYFGLKHKKSIKQFMEAYTQQLIPPGLKGHVTGDLFNQRVKVVLEDAFDNDDEYELFFESSPNPAVLVMYGLERPDWCLAWKNRCVIGYNQIDIWSGGLQTNRGAKYILNDSLHDGLAEHGLSLVCVVSNWPKVTTKMNLSKSSRMYHNGRDKGLLCSCEDLISTLQKHHITNSGSGR